MTPRILVVSRARRPGAVRAPEGVPLVYIGRAVPRSRLTHGETLARGSPVGNPFRVPRGYDIASDPDDVLGQYRRWLTERLLDPASPQSREVAMIARFALAGPVALECWCAPAPCHGDVVREVVLAAIERRARTNEP